MFSPGVLSYLRSWEREEGSCGSALLDLQPPSPPLGWHLQFALPPPGPAERAREAMSLLRDLEQVDAVGAREATS